MDRRKFIGSAVATTVTARAFGFGLGRMRGHGALGPIPGAVAAFDYYISATGSASNDGKTVATAWPVDVLAYGSTISAATLSGKRIGFVGPYIPCASLVAGIVSHTGSGNQGVFVGLPGGTQANHTYCGSSDSSGNESSRSCTLDFHPNATAAQTGVTYGLAIPISAITISGSGGVAANQTLIELNWSGATNPLASMVGDVLFVDAINTSGLTGIGLVSPSHGGGGAGTLYTIAAVSSSSPWTVTIDATTSGTYTPGTQDAIYWNYPAVSAAGLGITRNSPLGNSQGWITINGVNVTGAYGHGITANASSIAAFYPQSYIPTNIVPGASTTTFYFTDSGASNPLSVGQYLQVDGIEATGTGETLTSLNYASGGGSYAITAIGGTSPNYTVTIGVGTTGTYNTASPAYITFGMPGILIENCEVYDIVGESGGEPAALYAETTKGLKIRNCKLHDVNNYLPDTAGPSADGLETFYTYDTLVEYCTMYNVPGGVWHKSHPMGNAVTQYCFIQSLSGNVGWGVYEAAGQVVNGYSNIVRNCILIAPQCCFFGTTDSQVETYTSPEVYNCTLYQPQNLGTLTSSPGVLVQSGATTAGTPLSATPQPSGKVYNNIFNCLAGGSTMPSNEWGYIVACAQGTASAPTNINLSLSDYNFYDNPTGGVASVASYTLPYPAYIGGFTLSGWQTASGLDAHSNGFSGTPYASTQLGYQYPTSNFQIASGNALKGAARIGGVSGGAATDPGAWGGIDVNTGGLPAQIGSSF